jgi:hypothetical protein
MKRSGKSATAALVAACTEFNARTPIGTAVDVRRDNGEILRTKTRSEAWVIPSHAVLVMVEGISGGYRIDRVFPVVEVFKP